MATINGVLRTYGATVRRMEREQQRQAREAARKFKEQQKLEEFENAQQAVADWENYIHTIRTAHKNCTDRVDWKEIENTKKPTKPISESRNELIVQKKVNNYKPSFLDKLFGSAPNKIKQLALQLEHAKEKDKKQYDLLYKNYLEELKDWSELQEMSKGIKKRDVKIYPKILEYFDPFSDIGELGSQIKFSFKEKFVDIDLKVNSLEVIPDYELRLTSTGKLSKKQMPKSRFNELYQDHICSATLRVAREIFAFLPVDYAQINAISKFVNTKTGHLEELPILSIIVPPKTIEELNLESIDPSDSMQNFVHNMNFNKTKGFSVVKKVELSK